MGNRRRLVSSPLGAGRGTTMSSPGLLGDWHQSFPTYATLLNAIKFLQTGPVQHIANVYRCSTLGRN